MTGLQSLIVLLMLSSPQVAVAASRNIVTLDWTIAETLVAIDAVPQAVGQVSEYRAWVGEPTLPNHVADLGLRTQPNLELLAKLDPERILISPMFANLIPTLSRIAPVDTFELYAPGHDTWEQACKLTRELGRLTGHDEAAEALIEDTEAYLSEQRKSLPETRLPLLVVQFMDERHVRVFGKSSLYQAVIEQLGLENAWQRDTNYWGFTLARLEELIGIEAHLMVVEPYPMGVKRQLAASGLWKQLYGVKHDRVSTLSPVWSFGALPSARRFAAELVEALDIQDAT